MSNACFGALQKVACSVWLNPGGIESDATSDSGVVSRFRATFEVVLRLLQGRVLAVKQLSQGGGQVSLLLVQRLAGLLDLRWDPCWFGYVWFGLALGRRSI